MSIFALDKAVKRLTVHMEDLSARVASLETANRSLQLEYVELYDKVRHQMSRMARRAPVDPAPAEEVPADLDGAASALGVDPISAKILARRGIGRQAE